MAETTEPKPKSLAWKLAEVAGEVVKIAKAGFNANQKYAFVKESDVSDAVRPLLAERHIFLWSDEVERTMRPLFTTQNNATMWEVTVNVAYQFIDGETGEITPIQHRYGDGADTGDKALPKAQSMSLKYFLLKTFLLSTGTDDAEADEKVDKAAAAAGAAKGPVRVNKGTQAGVQRGGKSDGATRAQVSEIARKSADLGLTSVEEILPVIVKIIGFEPAEGQEIRDWLGTMTSQQAGDIITALGGMATFADVMVDNEVETVDNPTVEGVPAPFTIV